MFSRISIFISLLISISLFSQTNEVPLKLSSNIYRKEYSGSIDMHTAGFSIGYRKSRFVAWNKKRVLAFNICTIKHPKELKTSLNNHKNIIYGKLNSFFTLRSGVGYDKTINDKPIWGGVEVKRIILIGVSMGITKPTYIYVNKNDNIEKYNPEIHDQHNIIGKANFSKGIYEIDFYPGVYGKYGFGFDFGPIDENVKVLEIGFMLDLYLRKVKIMAYNKESNYFFNLYISYHIGKKTIN